MSVYTAIITPFNQDTKTVDYGSFVNILSHQIKNDIDGIVLFGTTGESPTLTLEEKFQLLNFTEKLIQESGKDIKLILGFGGNNTYQVIKDIKEFKNQKYVMLSAPYYNKPTQEGLYQHYTTIMGSFPEKEFMIYNIPGRTSVNIEPSTIKRIYQTCPNIFAIKEASGNMEQVKKLIEYGFNVFSGDDGMAYEVVSQGGQGVVSVLSNYYVKEMKDIVSLNSNTNEKMKSLYHLAFIETNPSPIKYILNKFKMIDSDSVRLPLVRLTKESENLINSFYNKEKIIYI